MSELWGADTLILLTILAGSFPCVTIDSRGETWAGWHKSPCGQSSWYQGPIKYRLHPMRTLTIFISGHRDLFFATPIQSDNHDSLTFTCDVSVSIRATAGSSPYFFDWDIRTLKSIVSLILIDTLRDTAYRRILPVTDDDLALIRNTFIDKFPTSSIVLISAIVTLTKVSLSWRESGSICNEYTDAKLYP